MLIRTLVAATLALFLIASPCLSGQAPVTQADIDRVKAEIERLQQDFAKKQSELRSMELQLSRQSTTPGPRTAVKPAISTKTPEPVQGPAPMMTSEPSPAAMPQRSNVDPTPYEASVIGRVPQFRSNPSSKWLVLDEKRVVFWVVNDEAYMLNLQETCPGMMSAEKLKLESFASKVRSGHDGVIFNDQRCLIGSIVKLGGKSLPRPPRK